MILNQGYIFIIFILNGIFIGILFDIFRILRRTIKTSDFFTYIEDLIFLTVSAATIIYSMFRWNSGEIRGYIFLGIILGLLIYTLNFSKIIIKFSVSIINKIKEICINIFLVIFKLVKKIFIKPVTFIIINLKKIFKKTKGLKIKKKDFK